MYITMNDGRSVLKPGQIQILELLFKYRFGSRQLLADSVGLKAASLFHKLEVLIKHGLIAKRQEPRQKLLGQPAAYFLTPKGLRTLAALPKHEYITETVIKASYKDGTVSLPFITHTLRVYAVTNHINALYPALKIYMRRDMQRYPYFPETLPDAFLSLPTTGNQLPKRFFLDLIPDNLPSKPFFQRLSRYADFFDDGGWNPVSTEPPLLLLIGETGATERRIRRTAKAALYQAETDEEIEAYTTTLPAIQNLSTDGTIWTHLDDPDELLALPDL